MAKYGALHCIVDFIERTVSKTSDEGNRIRSVLSFLKELSQLQDKNGFLTLTVHAGDGIWVNFKGRKLFLILPAQAHLTVLYDRALSEEITPLHEKLSQLSEAQLVEHVEYYRWRVSTGAMSVVTDFLESLPALTKENQLTDARHPRFFPGYLRQAALEQFEREGRYCPGARDQKRHKVSANERIEFDHILPAAKGGASSAANIQVLCQRCNNLKRATAL